MKKPQKDVWTENKLNQELTTHLQQAEHHLISAVELFNEHENLSRPTGYYTRLVRSQELVTHLHREELVRIRGARRRSRKGV